LVPELREDPRSSLFNEDAATEFQVQGLELDWTIVTWFTDLRWSFPARVATVQR